MSLRITSFVLILLSCLFVGQVSQAAAQSVSPSSEGARSIPMRPMPSNTRLRLFGAAFGGAALAGAASAAVGAGVYKLTVCKPNEHTDCDNENAGLQGFVEGASVAVGLALITMPIASAAFTQLAGRRAGYQGRFRAALIGSAVGAGVGSAAALAPFFLFDASGPGAIVGASLIGLTSVAGFGVLAYRLSDQRVAKLSATMTPPAEGRGLSIGVSGRF